MRHPWLRPLFGPMRRKAHTGVPADHFPPARLMHGDGQHALVADGATATLEAPPVGGLEPWWFPTAEAREAFGAAMEELGSPTREQLLAGLEEVGASRDKGDSPHWAGVATGELEPPADPPPADPAELTPPAPAMGVMRRFSEQERRRLDGDNEVTDPEQLAALVASAWDAAGGLEAWSALRERKGLTAAADADGNITPAAWHAYLCAEGVRTDDGRELMLGSCRYPDLPVSMRLLVEDEGGHWGAVTCGRIDAMEALDRGTMRYHLAEGLFGSDPNGQLAELMVEEQTQRFVSIDPRDATAEWIEIEVHQGEEVMYDCWLRIVDCVIGAATIVAMPALPQAVITLGDVELPEAPIANSAAPPTLPAELEPGEDEGEMGLAASGAPAAQRPHREWFEDPGFQLGDPRLVLQSDEESFACPLTIEEPDPKTGLRRVYGHVAWWNCDHTAFPGEQQKPPHSRSGYAYYNTGPAVECSDGSKVSGVGNVTMGCGHAPMFREDGRTWLTAQEAIAHYDGGYGAKQVFTGRGGEDQFGPWFAGYVRPDVTDAELAEAMTLNMSGDWREIAAELDMVAVLLVPVPGFPVRRQLAASGSAEVLPFDTRATVRDGKVLALVAAGIVRRADPMARMAHLERTVVALSERLAAQDEVLRPLVRERALGRAGL